MSLASGLKAKTTPNELALADERETLSWQELDFVLNRLTNALLADGLSPGQRVAVYAQNSVEAVLVYLAALQAGVSSVPVNYHLTVGELEYVLEESTTKVLYVGPETLEVGLAAAKRGGVSVVAWRCPTTDGVRTWTECIDRASQAEPPAHVTPAPQLHFTSGTTGRSKGTETPPTYLPRLRTVADLFGWLRSPRDSNI